MLLDAKRFDKAAILLGLHPRIRAYLLGKLGRCPYCMRWSALGMSFGWVAVAIAAVVGGPIGLGVTITAAVAFTTLFVLHVTTFTSRIMRGPERSFDVERRRFLATSAKVGGAVLAATVGDALFQGIALATGRETEPGNSFCAKLCQTLFPPGPERGRCISEGARGRGICFEGTCLPPPPATGDFKPKQTQEAKLQALLSNNPTSSTLAGNFFHTARRFFAHKAPANQLETRMFPVFAALPEMTKQLLHCSVDRFDALPQADRVTLFGELFAEIDLRPISTLEFSQSLASELQTLLLAELSVAPPCDPETPGLIRPLTYIEPIDNVALTFPVPWIDRLDSRRTKAFLKEGGGTLVLAEYSADEVEQTCQPDPGPPPGTVCDNTTGPCPADDAGFPGYEVGGVCLRVSTFVSGNTVTLEGINYYDVNARVRLFNSLNAREVEATVCGDLVTPLTDAVGNVIADSRVKDVIGFTIPEDLPDGIYEVTVIVTNPDDGIVYETPVGYRPVIRVLAPFNGRFQITSEVLRCNSETWPSWPGSDEVGIQIIATPIRLSLAVDPTTREYRFGDVDSSETREMISTSATGGSRLLVDVEATPDLIGAIISIAGYEVDSEDAYRDSITAFSDLYVKFLKEELIFLAAILGPIAAWFGVKGVAGLIAAHPILAAIAAAVILAIPVFIALWAPADPIIEDHIALSVVDLLQMTSASFPPPFGPPYTSSLTFSQGIEVQVTSVQKSPDELREQRRYDSSEEDSTYTLELLYRRVPAALARGNDVRITSTGVLAKNGRATLEAERTASSPPFTFHWQAAADHSGEPKDIRIYDVAGRQRARLRLGGGRAGMTSWDGSDSRGTPLPAGVYFAILSGSEARTRIVLVR